VLDRLSDLLTCKECNRKFDLSSQLKEHEQLHQMTGGLTNSLNEDGSDLQEMDTFHNPEASIDIKDYDYLANSNPDIVHNEDVDNTVITNNAPQTSNMNAQYIVRDSASNSNIGDLSIGSQISIPFNTNQNNAISADNPSQKGAGNETDELP
jgi:hypothetical protein